MLCDTSGVGERCGVLSTGSPFGHHPRLSMVCPRWGQWMRAGRFPFSLSPLLHFSTGSPFGHHPRLRMVCPPLGTVGADWEVSFFSPSPSPLLHFSTSPLLHFSTGSPFGHHPRLRMVCPLWGQWVDNELFLLLPRKTNSGEECVFS